MIFGSKSKLDINELLKRKEVGSNYIEIYTDLESFNNPKEFINGIKVLKELNMIAYAIHAPMTDFENNQVGLGIEDRKKRKEYLGYFKRTIEAAYNICNVPHPIVIFHPGGYYEIDKSNKNQDRVNQGIKRMKEDICYLNSYAENNYPNVILTIENMPAISCENNQTFCYDFGSDIKDLSKIIRELNKPNIRVTLDICHALSVCNYKRENEDENIELEQFIKEYSDILKLVHLNNVVEFGEIQEKHGIAFTEKENDLNLLKRILKSLEEINYNGLITVEVTEDNIINPKNLEMTLENIKRIGY